MRFTRNHLKTLIDALHGMSEPSIEFEVYEQYPGRGMYGRSCLGFTTDSPLELHGAICAVLAEDATQAFCDDFDPNYEIEWFRLRPSMDSMGLSSILYYTNLELVD
jgi:hypothetical protein